MAEINGTKSSITFKVTRQTPELIHPAGPTPYESKELSDLDSTKKLRFQAPIILFYKNPSYINPYLGRPDPVKVIKEAIAKALVSYYPLAGRLRETKEGKLVVECNGEGVLFIEADADVTLDDFGHLLHPPFPCSDELLYDVPGSSEILHSPLLLFQMTRLKCGGFIFALRLNHAMTDGTGLLQFLVAVTELAGGARHPSISPVWMRHLLSTRRPSHGGRPSVCNKSNYSQSNQDTGKITSIFPLDDLVHKSFFFGSKEITRLQESIRPPSTTFELITAHLWRCRTMALYDDPQKPVQLRFNMNTRSKYNPSLPAGYYGNVIAVPSVQATVDELSGNPFQYTVDLVKRTKDSVTEEYLKSLVDRLGVEGRDNLDRFLVADHRRLRFNCLDFGLGEPVYGGYLNGGFDPRLGSLSCFNRFKHFRELGVLVPVCLPRFAMTKFVKLFSLV